MAASVNLSKMNLDQLVAHKAEVEGLIANYEVKQTENIVNSATQAAMKAAKEAGATAEQLEQLAISLNVPAKRGRKPAAASASTTKAKSAPKAKAESKRAYPAVKPKYAHPENSSLTWSGRGRTPAWVSDYTKQKGKKIEDLAIA